MSSATVDAGRGTLLYIEHFPGSYERVNDQYRRAFLKHFPFVIVYRMLSDHIEISGVLPTQADPTAVEQLTASSH